MAIPAAETLIKIEDTRKLRPHHQGHGLPVELAVRIPRARRVASSRTLARDSDAARQLGSGIDPRTVDNYLLDVDNPLVVPAGTKIRLLLTAKDVIHAWWVPAFGMKKDAIPGFINEIWVQVDADKAGIYRGQCAELCGTDHGFMPIVVEVKPRAEFDAWLRAAGRRTRGEPREPPQRSTRAYEQVTELAWHTAHAHAHAHDDHATTDRAKGIAPLGLRPPTTRTSARCTWCSRCMMFFIGGAMAMVIRAELFQPGLQLVDPSSSTQMTTMHALIMIFGAVMPAFVGPRATG